MNTIRHTLTGIALILLVKTVAQQSIIAGTGNHIFYDGMPNPIIVLIDGIPMNEIVVSADNGIVTGSNAEYNVEVKLGPQRTCTVKAGKLLGKSDTLWLQKQEFIIRPTPNLSPSINGKEGGNISRDEISYWNFFDITVGARLEKVEYDIVISSRKYLKQYHKYSQVIGDSLKNAFADLEKGDKIGFINIKFTDPDTKRFKRASDLWFTMQGGGIEETINNKSLKRQDSLKNYEIISELDYKYAGKKTENKKDGLWVTYENGCNGAKVAETLYRLDSILETKQFYCNGTLMCRTRYFARDTASIITYYSNGMKCYEGNYRASSRNDIHISGFDGSDHKDYFLNDTITAISDQTYSNSKIPAKLLIGKWKFYYKDGKLAAEGNYNYSLDSSALDDGSYSYYYNLTREGTWNYFLPAGYLFHKATYENGKTVVESFYNSKGVQIQKN